MVRTSLLEVKLLLRSNNVWVNATWDGAILVGLQGTAGLSYKNGEQWSAFATISGSAKGKPAVQLA